jgi:hypothetical protein
VSNRTPMGRLKFKVDGTSYGVVTLWRGDKGISISLDKHSDKYPAMNPLTVFKRWAGGEGFLDYFPADVGGQRAPSGGGGNRRPEPDPFADDDLPFD